MIKKDISEIKRLFTPNNCSISRICGCYVDGEKNVKATFKEAFMSLPEEDMFKYFEILRKTLSGSLDKNLLNLDFPLDTEMEGGPHESLMALRKSELMDDEQLTGFYQKIIDTYEYVGNYLILLIFDAYDIPGKASDGLRMEDASDEVYRYLLCSICPVNLSKPALSYHELESSFSNRIRDWIVGAPEVGFLFPSFEDRSTNIHRTLYFSKNANDFHDSFIEQLLGCPLPLPAGAQKETFQFIIEETLGDDCAMDVVRTIHDTLNEMIEEHKEEPEPLLLDKFQVKGLLESSGVTPDKLTNFDKNYDEAAGEKTILAVNNVASIRAFEVKTPDVLIKVNPDRSDLIETRVIDGKQYLVIDIEGSVEVNGILVKAGDRSDNTLHSE